MNDDGLALEFFASEVRPNDGEDDAHEEDKDWLGRIGSSRGESDRRSKNKRGAVGEIFN